MNYLQIPSALWPHISHLSGLQVAIYCDAVTWANQGKEARRSNDTLAQMFGVTSRAVTKAVARLSELGLVDLEAGPNNLRTIKPRTTVHLNDRSPRTTVHPEQVFEATPNDCSMQPRTSVLHSPERPFDLYNHREEQREEQREEPKAESKKRKAEMVVHDVVLPFDTDTFRAAWREWLEYKWHQHRFAYKRAQDEQTALHNIQKHSNNDERVAIHIIATSIANGWKGLFENSAKSYMGGRSRTGSHLRASGEYEHPADVLKDSSIWG
jgi:hypothetical protein